MIAGLISTLGTAIGEYVSHWYLSSSLSRTVNITLTVYLPLISTVFHLIFFSNLIGMVPYSSTPTVEIIMTLSIAITLLVAVFFIGFLSHKLMLLAAFIPAGTPLGLVPLMIVLEILAYVTRTLSLGMR